MKDFLNKNSKHIIIAVAVIVAAFILKPERSAFEDCYYENKKFESCSKNFEIEIVFVRIQIVKKDSENEYGFGSFMNP